MSSCGIEVMKENGGRNFSLAEQTRASFLGKLLDLTRRVVLTAELYLANIIKTP